VPVTWWTGVADRCRRRRGLVVAGWEPVAPRLTVEGAAAWGRTLRRGLLVAVSLAGWEMGMAAVAMWTGM
jgi:hypothetical protein